MNVRDSIDQPCYTLQQLLSTSLGPRGLDKLMQDDLGRMTYSNDGATIMSLCPWQHAVCHMLRDVALSQDEHSGDGTTSVVLLACELLNCMRDLMQDGGVDLELVLRGMMIAERYCVDLIRQELQVELETAGERQLSWSALLHQLARSSLQSKIVKADLDHFASIVVSCVQECFGHNADEDQDVDNVDDELSPFSDFTNESSNAQHAHFSSRINVIRAVGNKLTDSFVFSNGFIMEHPIDNIIGQLINPSTLKSRDGKEEDDQEGMGGNEENMERSIGTSNIGNGKSGISSSSSGGGGGGGGGASLKLQNCQICLLDIDMDVDKVSRQQLSHVEWDTSIPAFDPSVDVGSGGFASEIQQPGSLSQKVWQAAVEQSGVSVVFLSTRFPVELFTPSPGIIVLDCVPRSTLYRISSMTGANVLRSVVGLTDKEVAKSLGTVSLIEQRRIGQVNTISIKAHATTSSKYSTIVVRGSSNSVTAEVERSLNDALSVTLQALCDKSFVAGGGAVELALSNALRQHAISQFRGKLQLALERYADALLVIPRTLARSCANASQAEDIISHLKLIHARHQSCETDSMQDKLHQDQSSAIANRWKYYGVDVLAKRPKAFVSDETMTKARPMTVSDLQQSAFEYRCGDMVQRGVIENAESRVSVIQLATQVASILLRVNESVDIKVKDFYF